MKSLLLLATLVMGVLAGPPGCESSPPPASAEGVGKACKVPKDCGPGQTCLMYSHPECPGAKCQECQIRCAANADCPPGYACNLPPLLPDTVPYICAKP
ncbi:MAG: hypothetical protein ACRERE_37340 [Candidatus Entotheonellia bacterium]